MTLHGEGIKTAVIITQIEVIQQLDKQIGSPISYEQYTKQNFKNLSGDNRIVQEATFKQGNNFSREVPQ